MPIDASQMWNSAPARKHHGGNFPSADLMTCVRVCVCVRVHVCVRMCVYFNVSQPHRDLRQGQCWKLLQVCVCVGVCVCEYAIVYLCVCGV
jgi:hypothetical protein